jgi:hypothetical protein
MKEYVILGVIISFLQKTWEPWIYIYIYIYSWFTLDEEVGWLMQKKIYIDHEEGQSSKKRSEVVTKQFLI